MKSKIYVETTIVSYLTSKLSRDLIIAAHKQIPQEWWEIRRQAFDLFVSELVIREAGAGDEVAAQERLDALKEIALLELNEETLYLARELVQKGPYRKRQTKMPFTFLWLRYTGWIIF